MGNGRGTTAGQQSARHEPRVVVTYDVEGIAGFGRDSKPRNSGQSERWEGTLEIACSVLWLFCKP